MQSEELLNLESDEQAEELYDFLYRDAQRIASYYAQIFNGRLTSIEKSSAEKRSAEKGAKFGMAVAGADVKQVDELVKSSKNTFEPHDIITIDVLSHLSQSGICQSDIVNAPHGSLVIAKGSLVFMDGLMLDFATVAFDTIISTEKAKPKNQQDKATLQSIEMMKSFVSKLSFPSSFFLQSEDLVQVAGTIKDAGLEEPITTYYFKHGTMGLSDVYVLGIKEISSNPPSSLNTPMLAAAKQMAQALTELVFPQNAIKVTPIALFRKL